jgi:hypothetical protein
VENYIRGCTWQLTKAKTIYMFTKLVFDRGDSNLECFNRTIYNYWRLLLLCKNVYDKWMLELHA